MELLDSFPRAGLLPQLLLPVCLCAICPLHTPSASYLGVHLGIITQTTSNCQKVNGPDGLTVSLGLQFAQMGQATRTACWRQARLKGWCSPSAAFLLF